ncbi:MAG: hypothetical protein AB7G75_18290 [Candidatus Binatia bacterium]
MKAIDRDSFTTASCRRTICGADHPRRIVAEAQTIVSDALAASPHQPGIRPKNNSQEDS